MLEVAFYNTKTHISIVASMLAMITQSESSK